MRKNIVCAVIKRINANNKSEYLLLKENRDFGKYSGFLQPVGGHVEEGENEENALIREIKEELGVGAKIEKFISETSIDVAGKTAKWYECKLTDDELNIDKDDVLGYEWLTLEDISKREDIWPATKKFMLGLEKPFHFTS